MLLAAVVMKAWRVAFVLGSVSLWLVPACDESESSNEEAGFRFSCDDPACCTPVDFDAARSRAYLVDGQLMLFIAARGEPTPAGKTFEIGESRPGDFDARVKTELEITYCGSASFFADSGDVAASCVARPSPGMACGQSADLELRLRQRVTDPITGLSRCGAAPFSRVAWKVTPHCPECPTEMPSDQACDHPPFFACTYPRDCGIPECGCGLRHDTGERVWQCTTC